MDTGQIMAVAFVAITLAFVTVALAALLILSFAPEPRARRTAPDSGRGHHAPRHS